MKKKEPEFRVPPLFLTNKKERDKLYDKKKQKAMEKKLYWLVESNGDLSVTTSSIEECKTLIENDFKENNDGYDMEDFQYTITPTMLTQEEYEALCEA